MVTFHYAEKVWSAQGIRYWPVRRVDGNLCATERGSPKKIYDRPRRCETRYFSCGLEGYPCITDEIPGRLLVAEPLEYNDLELDGHKLVAMNAGRTDTGSLHLLARPVNRTDRWRGRRLQRNSSLSGRDRHTEPA